MRAQR